MLNSNDNEINITDEEFRLIRDLLHEHCGVYYDDSESSKYFIDKRLAYTLEKNQLSSFTEFYYMIKYDKVNGPAEMSSMVDLLTIHETYFFREDRQLTCFQKELLPELHKKNLGTKQLKIWSAGCSTGEEAYTLAMLIEETGMFKEWDWEVIATDLSPQVLSKARKGCYRKSAFRGTNSEYETYLAKYFHQDEEEIYTISDELKKHITFFQLNLMDEQRLAFISRLDVIFCRNVIIYFNHDGKKRVINTFRDKLIQNGFLLLGHSESLMSISNDFALRHFNYDMVYQKECK